MAKAKRMGFGKHKGKLYSEIPVDYLEWLRSIPNDGRRRAFPERTLASKEIKKRRKEFSSNQITP